MRTKAAQGRCGSAHHAAVLAEADVLQIRMRAASGVSQHALAAEFHVSVSTINGIVTGRRWQHVGGPVGRLVPSLDAIQLLAKLAKKHGTSATDELALAVRERFAACSKS